MTSALARGYIRRAVTRLGGQVQALISAWPQFPDVWSCDEDVRVYWPQDDFAGGADLLGLDEGHLEACERDVAARADFVAACSPVLAEIWRSRGAETILIPNGADLSSMGGVEEAPRRPVDVPLPGPMAGFVGHINARTDLELLEAIVDRGRSLLMVGP